MRVNKAIAAATLAVVGWIVISRLGHRWGATDREVEASLPADELVPDPFLETTHAITIDAPPSAVWPWLVQAGFHRGGWYTDAWWDTIINRALARIGAASPDKVDYPWPSADHILAEYQGTRVGDVIPDGPPGTAFFTVRALEPERLMALYSDSHLRFLMPPAWHDKPWASSGEFTWVFALDEAAPGSTRLMLRTRSTLRPRLIAHALLPMMLFGDFIFARQLLNGVKRRAESMGDRSRRT